MKKTISVLLAVTMLFSLCACSQNKQYGISIKPTEFSEETLEVLDLFDDEIQFFDISLDENVSSLCSVKGATLPCTAYAVIPCGLAVRRRF